MRIIRYPFVKRDLIGMVDHTIEITQGDIAVVRQDRDIDLGDDGGLGSDQQCREGGLLR